MKILITDEMSISNAFTPLNRSFRYSFSFVPTIITARQLAAVTPSNHTVVIFGGNKAVDFTEDYDIVHMNFKTALAPRAYEIADKFRQEGKLVILSGYHPTALPDEAKQHADSVIIGDAVTLWPSVIHDIESGHLRECYQSETSCDSMVLPSTKQCNVQGIQFVNAIEATRGCPQKCDFCQDSNIRDGAVFVHAPSMISSRK